MQKITNKTKAFKIIALILDTIVLLYFSLYVYWMFGIPDIDTNPLSQLFITINPMTAGVYCLGVAMLVHLIAYKNILSRCIISLPYALSTTASTVSLIAMTGWRDLIIFIPHIFIIAAAVTIIVNQRRSTKINCNTP